MEALALYSILSTALYYLGSRAMITQPLWSRYPPGLARFADCPACSGTWYGAGLAVGLGRTFDISFFMFKSDSWFTPIVVGFCMMMLTPMVAGLLQHALNVNGSAVELESMIRPGTAEHTYEPVSPSK
jgi:hypothetical protein